MDAYNVNNNREQQQQQQNDYDQPPHEPTAASLIAAPTAPGQQQAFSYSLPMHDADEEDSESNKSTPYYTPLEFSQSSFEFPSPKPKHAPADLTTTATTTTKDQPLTSVAEYAARKLPTVPPSPSSSLGSPAITVVAATPSSCKAKPPTPGVAPSTGSSALHSPPVINRKLRRFSLYERRSCSPQHLLVKNSSLGSGQDSPDPTHHLHHDKENTKPPHGDEPQLLHTPSGNSSPAALLEDGGPTATLSSPKILGAANEANMFGGGGGRLAYSPKLLASINNLNLSGSPLSVLSSAGYKNGNYFKFPEIDHVVQVAEADGAEDVGHMSQDNQNRSSRRRGLEKGGNSSPDALWGSRGNASGCMPRAAVSGDASEAGRPIISKSNVISATDTRKNRKNKNNLTIRITDIAPQVASSLAGGSVAATTTTTMGISPSPSPSPKPKTPTIKSTKEKALSLDSAATGGHELKIIVSCRQDHGSCQDIDGSKASEGPPLGLDTVSLKIPDSSGAHLSSSLNQLSSEVAAGSLLCGSAMPNKPSFGLAGQRLGESFMRTSRRRISGSASGHSDWYQRQQNSFLSKSLNVDPCGEEAERPAIFTKVMQTSNSGSLGPSPGPGATASTPVGGGPRGPFKLNPLLHASNTNLKTLPEFLTLVEFSNPKEPAGPGGAESPYKQKSMDLPSSSLPAGLRVAKPQVTTSTSSTNLLQRRGSNHSLTLNLHGSCGNLLGNCRSGLSVSNYSLGSVAAASTTNLNSKSSGNLECGSSVTSHAPTAAAATTSAHVVVDKVAAAAGGDSTMAGSSAQVTKQTLFRRRGSNHSLTLTNLAATSCGSLNSFASQNSLNVDRLHLHPHGDAGGVAVGGGVTRTTSFITPSKLSGGGGGTKRGLLERRGSNQSLTLNMGGSFGGIGTERSHHHAAAAAAAAAASSTSNYYEAMGCSRAAAMAEPDTDPEADTGLSSLHPPTGCAQHRKFFSSESLNRNNTQFSDLNQAHKRNANQVCFGSVSDLKPSGEFGGGGGVGGPGGGGSREHFDFQESTMCTCSGVRNIGTRPLSPQTTSEEFKIYLANIQMLQNASNALNQLDLIKLNYIFDNSYLASGGKGMASQPLPVLSVHESRDAETPPGLVATSEDHEVAARFQEAVGAALQRVQPSEEETKRLFCDLHKEFWDLPLNHQEKPMVFGSQAKNRYKTILPNENSRVLLERESTIWADLLANYDCLRDEWAEPLTPRQAAMVEEVPYINANYIKGPDYNSKCYVATQGPLPNTIFEFWLMVYLNTQKHLQNAKKLSSPITKNGRTLQQYYQKIVMLTNFLENNRQKCATYFPVELNELLVVTPKHEVLPANEPLTELLNEYLHLEDDASPQLGDTQSESGSVSIEFLKTSLSAEQSSLMPQHTNFFAVKNVGIVRKNGFSIRKLVALYCVRIPAKEAGEPQQFLVQKFRCYHYWYPDWPDHRSPRDINTLLDICLHVLNLGKCEVEFDAFAEECSPGPGSPAPHIKAQEVALYQQDIFNSVQPLPIIHCSAGIGRTGCFTAILNGIRQLRQSLAYSLTSMASAASRRDGNGHVLSPVDFCLPADFVKDQPADEIDRILSNDTDSSFTRNTMLHMKYILERQGDAVAAEASGEWQLPSLRDLPKMPDVFVDILGIVCNLRLQRGGMVQNSEQYELIHRAICLYMKRAFALKRF